MITQEQKLLLEQLAKGANREQFIWLSGYFAGLAGVGEASVAPAVSLPAIDIYYATETGNSKALSLEMMKALKATGAKVKNAAVNRLKIKDISTDRKAVFIISTHGEGDPPEAARAFFEQIRTAPDGALSGLSYAVLGLGDSSYEIFCGAATELDKELTRLGGKRFYETALFDVDYATKTSAWIEAFSKTLQTEEGVAPSSSVSAAPTLKTGKGYSRLEPVKATVKENIILNDTGSKKKTYHLELTPETPLDYTPGDALGIILPADEKGEVPTPRLYSIASSPSAHEGEVHLTVALATHKDENGEIGFGLTSGHIAGLQEGDEVTCYIQQNQIFGLPEDERDMIMIGPGTGIAPFRSFVCERAERGATGRNWLFFGDQHAHLDFLYQAEWQEHLATGALSDIDLAFSRDQEEKIYVQHKLKTKADKFIERLDGGAAIYVCGARDPMSRDVEAAILEILRDNKGLTAEQAEDYLADLAEQNRYVKDVY